MGDQHDFSNDEAAHSSVRMEFADADSLPGRDHVLDSGSCRQALSSVPVAPFNALDSDCRKVEPEPMVHDVQVASSVEALAAVPNLTIRPQRELPFLGPFNREVTTRLIIANPASNCVLFKIKTTKSDCYKVQPNIGRLAPMQKMTVEITLKPQERDLAAERDLHQFLVEGMFAPSDLTDLESMRNLMRQTTDQKSKTTLQCDFRYSSPTSPLSDENNA